jgi:hypothetical protein
MLEKVSQLFIGIVLILMGMQAFFSGGYWSTKYGRYISYAPFPRIIGAILVIIGLIFACNVIKTVIRDRKKGRPPRGK